MTRARPRSDPDRPTPGLTPNAPLAFEDEVEDFLLRGMCSRDEAEAEVARLVRRGAGTDAASRNPLDTCGTVEPVP